MPEDFLTAPEFLKPFPDPENVFLRDVEQHHRYLLPLATLDLSAVSPYLEGTIHFIQPVEPYNGVVGESGEEYFNHFCRPNWVGFQYVEGKCELLCDFKFFEMAQLESTTSRSPREQKAFEQLQDHYNGIHSEYRNSKDRFRSYGALYHPSLNPPFERSERLELLTLLGGESESFSCNWAALEDMPLVRHSPEHSVPILPDGREFIFIGELSTMHYIWDAPDCQLLLFYDSLTRIALTTFDWS
ncbi:hypothetical protein [Rubinisphaera margarita]|uniref:hypothetical protein n=1 Tax=Rubinisphaera margarita TaxID=2909586 RepID=UPI001EE947F6|nr:hypothetical protein [Rubinisphaera margarita]MCG6158569.1 hypothetical protein [Rubinisphaera margarita]